MDFPPLPYIALLLRAVITCFIFFFIYLAGIVVYNLFFHPYSKYPGPLWARVSPLYALWHAYIGDLHIDVLHCHEKYGSFVRYSPNRVVVNTVTGLRAIYGQGKNLQKAKGYAPHPYFPKVFNTHNCIDKGVHGRKRRIVSQGFSEATLASSEQYVLEHVRNLCAALMPDEGDSGEWSKPRDMGIWTNYFTLDVISDLTFGQSFSMIVKPDLRWLVDAIVGGNRHIYMRFAYPAMFNMKPDKWYSPARWLFPTMGEERTRFAEVADKCSRERMALVEQGKCDRQDIMTALLAAQDPKTGEKLTAEEVWGEAHLMIAAGGDTTSTALAAVFFYLSQNSGAYSKLSSEIRSTFSDVESIRRGKTLSNCHYLKACIDEALRLAPAAPGALWREVCPGGAMVDGEYIPAGYDLGVCTYALSHNAEYFPDPFKFQPERFINHDTVSKSATAGPQGEYFGAVANFSPSSKSTSPAELGSISSWLTTTMTMTMPPTPPLSRASTPTTLPSLNNPTQFPSHFYPSYPQPPTPLTAPPSLLTPTPTPTPNNPNNNNLDAFAPFAIGPRSCLAKPLAYLELSLALARIVWLLDFEKVDDTGAGGFGVWAATNIINNKSKNKTNKTNKGRARKEEFQITDMFSSNKVGPLLRFRRRRRY